MSSRGNHEFEKASRKKESSLVAEFWGMLMENKKFWLVPLIVGLLFLGLIVIVGGTAAAPFIYSLF
jgi:hypothetical protein